MREEVHNGWPYGNIEHWPPMTYRNRATQNPKALLAFDEFLNSEPSSDMTIELQPWLPFCEGRCAFCYFPVSCEKQKVAPYMEAMKKVLAFYAQKRYVKSSVFNELYIGGGSPSVLANEQIVDLLKFCRSCLTLSSEHQTKFAACTTNLSEGKIRLLSENQVDQLDIGIQTFNDSFRKMLLLRDSGEDARLKLKTVKKHGLRASIDLLYNLPGQTVNQWKADIEEALALDVESVDCYPLDLYSETLLAKQIVAGETPPLGDTETELAMYLEAYKIFKKNGYSPTCHNRFSRVKEDFTEPSSEVLGSGAGFFMGHVNRFQYSDIEDIEEYTAAVKNGMFPIARLSELAPEDEMRKAMMLIYIRKSVDREKFKAQFGKFPEDAFPNAISKLEKQNLIEIKQGKIQLTEKGDPWRFNIAWEFFS